MTAKRRVQRPPAGKLVLASDGNLARTVRPWASEKLSYLKRYIDIFTTSMKGKWDRLVYIDLMCGPGKSIITDTSLEIEGSPLLALHAKYPFTQLYLNDKDARALKALEQRIGNESATIQTRGLDCNGAAREAGGLLNRRDLALAFIDPTAFQISFDGIANLTQGHGVDLIITVMTGYIRRFIGQPSYESAMDRFFGFPEWRELIEREAGRRSPTYRDLLDKYEAGLRAIGYIHVNDVVRVPNTRGQTIYHIVFASKHRLGGKFFDEVTKRQSSGQQRMML